MFAVCLHWNIVPFKVQGEGPDVSVGYEVPWRRPRRTVSVWCLGKPRNHFKTCWSSKQCSLAVWFWFETTVAVIGRLMCAQLSCAAMSITIYCCRQAAYNGECWSRNSTLTDLRLGQLCNVISKGSTDVLLSNNKAHSQLFERHNIWRLCHILASRMCLNSRLKFSQFLHFQMSWLKVNCQQSSLYKWFPNQSESQVVKSFI